MWSSDATTKNLPMADVSILTSVSNKLQITNYLINYPNTFPKGATDPVFLYARRAQHRPEPGVERLTYHVGEE